LKTRKKR